MKVIGLSGSLRAGSHNAKLLRAAVDLLPPEADLTLYEGLKSIPPFDEEPAMHFALLAKIAARLGLKELSMGMSGDFAKAIAFGATYVRIGTAIFGARATNDD